MSDPDKDAQRRQKVWHFIKALNRLSVSMDDVYKALRLAGRAVDPDRTFGERDAALEELAKLIGE